MATKKYYAVKKGKKTGIFKSWEECRASVDGCPGAEYKGFGQLAEAEAYLGAALSGESPQRGGEGSVSVDGFRGAGKEAVPGSRARGPAEGSVSGRGARRGAEAMEQAPLETPEAGTLLAYVDGSYDDTLKRYSFGCVFLLPDGRICTEYGNGDNAQSLRHRNVTGEMLGAMYAVKTAMLSGFSIVEIHYDYEGIEKWVTGAWRSKTELTRKYAMSMREWGKSITIRFTKVVAHTNVYYNEMADKMAKTGLREGNGIPKLRSLQEEGA